MNSVNVTGRITHDLSLKVTQSNKHVLEFQIAIWESKDVTTFVRCIAWETSADIINDKATKGSMLAISGSLKVDKYKDKNGNNVEKTMIVVNRVEVLDHRKEELDNQNKGFVGSVQGQGSADKFGKTFDGIQPDDLPFY